MTRSKSLYAWLAGNDEAASENNTRDAAEAVTEQETETEAEPETDDTSATETETDPEGTEATPDEGGETETETETDDASETDTESAPAQDEAAAGDGYCMSRDEVMILGAIFGDSTAAAECLVAGMTYEEAVAGLAKAQASKLAAVEKDLADRDERLAQIAAGSAEEALSGGTENAGAAGPRRDGLNENLGRFADGMKLKK